MIGQALIAFREGLEAALITAIILAYLRRSGRGAFTRYVWYGVYLAVLMSIIVGVSTWFLYGGLSGPMKALFEGVSAFLAVLVLSSMIYWMALKGRRMRREIEERVEAIVSRGASFGMVSFSFIVVFREGLETVLFLTPFLLDIPVGTLGGALLGIAASLLLAYAIFIVGMRIDLRRFFFLTSLLLVLLAGGLTGYGVHELIEYYEERGVELGWLGDYAYILDIPEGHPLHHKGAVGSILAVMFGYTVKAEWGRLIAHLTYLTLLLPLVLWIYYRR